MSNQKYSQQVVRVIGMAFILVPAIVHGWTKTAEVFADDGVTGDVFGLSVGLSGQKAIVGAYLEAESNYGTMGSAYLFNAITGQQTARLVASDASSGDSFGYSVGISGDTAIVGAFQSDHNGQNSGSAYVFDANTGNELFRLLPSDGASNDGFGGSVAISNDIAVIGAAGSDDFGTSSGSAYVFDTATGTQLHKLTPSDAGVGDNFGRSVSVSGDLAIIGASMKDGATGAAYVFDVETGNEIAKLTASDGSLGDMFGNSVAIAGNLAVVGSYGDDDQGMSSGSAYVFNLLTGEEVAKLTTGVGAPNDRLGASVALVGNTVLVGATGSDIDGANSGSVYLFDATTGALLQRLDPETVTNGDAFGTSVAASAGLAIVGAYGTNGFTGNAHIFASGAAAIPEPAHWIGLITLMGCVSLVVVRRYRAQRNCMQS